MIALIFSLIISIPSALLSLDSGWVCGGVEAAFVLTGRSLDLHQDGAWNYMMDSGYSLARVALWLLASLGSPALVCFAGLFP